MHPWRCGPASDPAQRRTACRARLRCRGRSERRRRAWWPRRRRARWGRAGKGGRPVRVPGGGDARRRRLDPLPRVGCRARRLGHVARGFEQRLVRRPIAAGPFSIASPASPWMPQSPQSTADDDTPVRVEAGHPDNTPSRIESGGDRMFEERLSGWRLYRSHPGTSRCHRQVHPDTIDGARMNGRGWTRPIRSSARMAAASPSPP